MRPNNENLLPWLVRVVLAVCALGGVTVQAQQPKDDLATLRTSTIALLTKGKWTEALSEAKKLLDAQESAGKETVEVAEVLHVFGDIQTRLEKWDDAQATRQKVVALCEKLHGEKDWRTGDARRASEYTELIRKLSAEDRKALFQSDDDLLESKVTGKYVLGLSAAESSLKRRVKVLGENHYAVANVYHQLGRVTADPDDRVAFHRKASVIREATLGEDHPETARSLSELGMALTTCGNPEAAVANYQKAIRVFRKTVSAEDDRLALTLNNLGLVQSALGEYKAAKKSLTEALDLRRNALPKDHPYIAECLYDLGVLQGKTGENESAKKSLTEALDIRRKTLPKGHPDLINSLIPLANALRELGEYEAAKRSLTEALSIQRAAFSNDSHRLAYCLVCLGGVLRELGEYEAAKKSFTEGLAIYRKLFPKDDPDIAYCLVCLGNVLKDQREYEAAKKSLTEALEIRRKSLPKGHGHIADCLHDLGGLQSEMGENEAAMKSFTEVLEIRRKLLPKDHPYIAVSLIPLGKVLRELRDYEPAKQSLTEALDICRKAFPKDHPCIAECLSDLGALQSEIGENEAAKKCLTETLDIRRKTLPKGHPLIAKSLIGLGAILRELREYEAAKKTFTEALDIYRKAFPKGHPHIGIGLTGLATVLRDLREYEAAKKGFTEALDLQRLSLPKGHPHIADSLIGLGNVQMDLQDLPAARKSFTEALDIKRASLPKDHPDIAAILSNLGLVQWHFREYEAAKKSLTEALEIQRKSLPKGHPQMAGSLTNLANVQRDLQDHTAAMNNHTEALEIRRKSLPKDHPDIAMSLTNLGLVQIALEKHEAAKKSFTEALEIRRKSLPKDHPDIAYTLVGLGGLLRDLREYEAARECLTEALEIRRKSLPKGHPDIAESLLSLGSVQENDAALKNYAEALDIQRACLPPTHPDIAQTLNVMGIVQFLNRDPKAAWRSASEALDIKTTELTRIAHSQAEFEQLRSATDLRFNISAFLSAALATNAQDDATLYRCLAPTKGAVTARQRWARQARDDTNPAVADLHSQLAAVDVQLLEASLSSTTGERSRGAEADLPTRLATLVERRKDLERQLLAKSEAYRTYQAKAKLTGDDIRTALPADWVLIDLREYGHIAPPTKEGKESWVERRFVAFVVLPGKAGAVAMVPLGKADEINQLVEQWRTSYATGKLPPKGQADPATELRKLVWEPIAKHIPKGTETVLISPEGSLSGLPFAALPGDKPEEFLLHQYAFVTIPVPILLPELLARKAGTDSPTLLAAGGVEFGDAGKPGGYRPLASTALEVDLLKDLFTNAFPKSRPTILKGAEATKATLIKEAPAAMVLHLATHGYFADESKKSVFDSSNLKVNDLIRFDRQVAGTNPDLLSGVALAGVNDPKGREAGLLTALEASRLDLERVELVTLSACDTGRGKVAGGEGVLGLQRGFQVAGARRVLSTLWSVDDAATQKVMTRFYDNLWVKKLPAAKALQEAQLWAVGGGIDGLKPGEQPRGVRPPGEKTPTTDHRHPFFWAAFTLAGDPR